MEDTAKYCRTGVGYPFWDISKLNYERYKTLKIEYDSKETINNPEAKWEWGESESEKDHAGFIAIVFSAIYIESEAYTYLATHLGDSYVKTHLDKLDPLSKWLVGVKLVTGKSLAKSGQAYEHCKSLF